jgi:arylsulfatase A-like enzyme
MTETKQQTESQRSTQFRKTVTGGFQMKKTTLKLTLTFLTALLLAPLAALHAADKPNLLILFTDDMGYADIGAYGCNDIPTPHLDRLAAEGTRFTSAYTVASVCVPSRMGLMSGQHPARFGVFDNVYSPQENQLWMQQTTLADVLKKQGYRTAIIGKWHLSGGSSAHSGNDLGGFEFKPPHERGFDEFVGITGGMHTFWKGTGLARFKDGKYQRFDSPDYLTDFFGTEACEFIQRVHAKNQEPGTKNQEPFFLYLAFNAPHAPLHGLDEDQAAIEAKDISPDRRKYAAMVRAVDRNVGRVMDKLREFGLAENTLTVFANDNGGGGNNANEYTRNTAINRPHRGHKFDVLEGGVRIPFILHWPGQVTAGKTFDGIASTTDVFPTFAKVASASADSETTDAARTATTLDGRDLMPFVKGEKAGNPHETLCWQQWVRKRPNERKPGPAYPVPAYNLAIRSGKWKAIKQDQPFDGTDDSRAWELYDLTQDPAELHDLATEFPDKVKELSDAFFAWQKQMPKPAPMPAAIKTKAKPEAKQR